MKTKETIGYGFFAVILALGFAALSLTGCPEPKTSDTTVQLPSNAISLTVGEWADGSLPTASDVTSSDVQWFTFTATASTQFIHADFGTLTRLVIQIYDSSGTAVGSEADLSSSTANTSRTLTSGQTYYIKVRSGSGGTYKIGFNTTFYPPGAIPLTENQWTDGNLTAGGVQWFTFTATASAQYIHVSLGTLTNLYVQAYDSSGTAAGSETTLSSSTANTSLALTSGQTYYIRVRSSGSASGTYRIGFSASAAAPTAVQVPSDAITFTADQWADGDLPTAGDEQWFTFTATASTQFIHFLPGTLSYLRVQIYDSDGAAVGSETQFNSSTTNTSQSLTVGETYYIRIRPNGSNSGAYRIGFTASATAPATVVELPPDDDAIPLTADQWENGSLPTSSDEQYFTFTATASTQFIHFEPGTLTSLRVQAYDSSGTSVGNETTLSSSTTSVSRTLAEGETYFIRARPLSTDNNGGDYRIAFNTTLTSPSITLTTLTENQWADGSLTSSGQQWFTFTATAVTQYIHFEPGTLTSLYVNVYDSSGAVVGSETNLYSSTPSTSRTLTAGQTYYIRVRPFSGSGTYKIGFNTSAVIPPGITLTTLTVNQWTDGNLPASSDRQWFTFTATASTQFIHFEPGTLTSLRVQVYNSSGTEVGNETTLSSSTTSVSRTLTSGQTYYIRARPSSTGSGTYKIAFNTSAVLPIGITPTTLTLNQWTNGNIAAAGGQQWFTFTATASTQYLHVDFGTLTNLYVQVYTSDGATSGSETNLDSYTTRTSRTLTAGQTYYIRARPYSSTGSGTYKIAFTTSSFPPGSITEFQFGDFSVYGTINGNNITVTVPNIVNLTALVPTITHNGKSISPESGVPQDFSSPVNYQVMPEIDAGIGVSKTYTVTVTVTNTTLATAFTWLNSNSESGKTYTIVAQASASVAPVTINLQSDSTNIILSGGTTEKTITLSSNGSLFTIRCGTLTLGNNITLEGRSSNNASLIKLDDSIAYPNLVMNTGSKITNNTAIVNSSPGNAVGGGVYVMDDTTFTMNGGTISGNKVTAENSTSSSYSASIGAMGGGVYVDGGTFIMNNGTISGNAAYSEKFQSGGGGVFVKSGTFTLVNGTISDNTAESKATVASPSAFGGGVAAWDNGTFTMQGGTISGNKAVSSATLATENYYGGGVYVRNDRFRKTGGTIYGSNETTTTLRNTAKDANSGHVAYASVGSTNTKRNTTAGTAVNLDSSITGNAGGWE